MKLATLLPILAPWGLRRLMRRVPMPHQADVLMLAPFSPFLPASLQATLHPASLTILNAPHALPGITTLAAPLHAIPLPANGYDVILAANLTSHPQWRQTLAECARLIRPGGILYILEIPSRTATTNALRAGLLHHGFQPVYPTRGRTSPLGRLLDRTALLTAMRRSLTQPEYD